MNILLLINPTTHIKSKNYEIKQGPGPSLSRPFPFKHLTKKLAQFNIDVFKMELAIKYPIERADYLSLLTSHREEKGEIKRTYKLQCLLFFMKVPTHKRISK